MPLQPGPLERARPIEVVTISSSSGQDSVSLTATAVDQLRNDRLMKKSLIPSAQYGDRILTEREFECTTAVEYPLSCEEVKSAIAGDIEDIVGDLDFNPLHFIRDYLKYFESEKIENNEITPIEAFTSYKPNTKDQALVEYGATCVGRSMDIVRYLKHMKSIVGHVVVESVGSNGVPTHAAVLPEESLARLRQRFGSKFQQFTAVETQALVTADVEGFVDNARMRQMTSEHPADVTKVLQILVSKGVLTQDGQGRWTRYCLASASVHREASYLHKDKSPLHKEGSYLHKNKSPLHNESCLMSTKELSDGELEELAEIARPAKQNKRLSYQELETILLKLCEGRWLTRKHLAELLGRNDEGLRNRFIAPMVERDLLCLRHPEVPSHLNQAYTKSTKD